jgi:hypothetical protein
MVGVIMRQEDGIDLGNINMVLQLSQYAGSAVDKYIGVTVLQQVPGCRCIDTRIRTPPAYGRNLNLPSPNNALSGSIHE